jgi:putative inorganic carbon (HCO3(-)) transporter
MRSSATRRDAPVPSSGAVDDRLVMPRSSWRQAVRTVSDYELLLVLIPVGAVLLVNQLPTLWVIASWVLIPILWLARWTARGKLTATTPLNVPVALLLVAVGIALYPSLDLSTAVPVLGKVIAGVALFYALVNGAYSSQRLLTVTAVLLLTGITIATLSLVNTNWPQGKLFAATSIPVLGTPSIGTPTTGMAFERLPNVLRALNPNGFHRNIVAGTVGMLFPFALAVLIAPPEDVQGTQPTTFRSVVVPRRLLRLLALIAVLSTGGMLLLTQARGALAGVLVALALLAWWRSRWSVIAGGIIVAGLIAVAYAVSVSSSMDSFLPGDVYTTTQDRLELWQRGVYIIQDFPFTGVGLGNFSRAAPLLYPLVIFPGSSDIPHVHNLYLQAGVESGVPGLIARLAVIAAFLALNVRLVQRTQETGWNSLAVGTLGGFAVYLIHGLVDDVTFSAKSATVLWALMGLATATWVHTTSRIRGLEYHPHAIDEPRG